MGEISWLEAYLVVIYLSSANVGDGPQTLADQLMIINGFGSIGIPSEWSVKDLRRDE